jgi:hypothetical protein
MPKSYVAQHKMPYLCTVFFMVLDLRLTIKIMVVVRQPFLFYSGT